MYFLILYIKEPIFIKDLATAMGLRPPEMLKELMIFGIFANINSTIEREIAESILKKHGMRYEFIE